MQRFEDYKALHRNVISRFFSDVIACVILDIDLMHDKMIADKSDFFRNITFSVGFYSEDCEVFASLVNDDPMSSCSSCS